MSSRKTLTKQERFDLVARFLESGQPHMVWCHENGIKPNILYPWRTEYKVAQQQDVCFVPLEPQFSKDVSPVYMDQTKINNVLIELGSCKVHVPEHMAASLLSEVFKKVVDTHV